MNAETNYFEEGRKDAIAFYSSECFAGFNRNISAEDAMKLFLPALQESMTQISTPYPKPRQKWLAGFRKGQSDCLFKNSLSTGTTSK